MPFINKKAATKKAEITADKKADKKTDKEKKKLGKSKQIHPNLDEWGNEIKPVKGRTKVKEKMNDYWKGKLKEAGIK